MSSILNGRYQLLKAAGSGGTANVYLAQATADGARVAVKVLKKSLAGQQDMLGRFHREAVLLQRIVHPHVVKLIELADAPEGLLLVMEWADGERLDTLALTPGEVKEVLRQLASALAAIHAAGVVHRDFKPENVIVRRAPEVHAWVLDLGIARFQDVAQAASQFVTVKGQGAGTPAFLSPEQIQGQDPDPRSDVYSFGVVAYRLLTGALPFQAPSDFELMQLHLSQPPPPLVVTDASLAGLESLVLKCLQKKRGARPKDGAALLAAMEQPSGPAKKKWWSLG